MKLVIATPLYPPEPGGPATYTKLLEEELPTRGTEVTIVKFSEVRKYPKLVRHLAYAFKVYQAARGADAVYALDPVSTGLPASLAARWAHKPFYLRIAGDYAWEQGTQRFGVTDTLDEFVTKRYGRSVQVLKRIQTRVAERARRIVVPSQYLKRIISAWGIDTDRISVVYNAAATSFTESVGERPSEFPGPYVVTVARLVPWKGIMAVIDALKLLRDSGSDLSLAVVGDGPESALLHEHALRLGIADFVRFTGSLDHVTTARYMAHADVFILNTRYEGFSHVILEAFALGVPVLTTPVGGNPEQVEDRTTGLVFTFNDAEAIAASVTQIREDSTLRMKVLAQAKLKLSTFTRAAAVDGTVAALQV